MPRITDLRLRRGTAAAWTSANPILGAGEPGLETDTGKVKWGDGATAWVSLPYFAPPGDWNTLSNKPSTFPPAAHSASLITSGTLALAQVPTMTSDKLAQGNDFTSPLDNPDFALGTLGWGGFASGDVKGITDGPVKASSNVLERTGSGAVQDFTNKVVPSAPNEKYYAQVWVRKTVAQTADGTVQFGTTVVSKTGVASWPAISVQAASLPLNTWYLLEGIITAPADAATIQPRLSIRNNMVDGTFQFANPVFRRILTSNDLPSLATSKITGLDTALAAKAPLASPAFTGTPTGITKAHVGLGNVDNTADSAKPVSTAQQTALDGKAAVGHGHSLATSTVDGFMPAADKAALDNRATGLVVSTIVARDSGGNFSAADPTVAAHVATKGYVDNGVIRGTGGKQYRQIGCVIRNAGTGFDFISDAGHVPVGVSSVETYSDRIVINYSFTATKVITANVTPDETLAQYGYSMGPSVGTSSMTIYVGQPGGFTDYVTANGSAVSSLNGFITGMTRSTTAWTFTHGTIKGPTGGSASYRGTAYEGVLDGLGATSTAVNLFSRTSGAQVNPSIQPSGTPYSFWIFRGGTRQVNPLTELDLANSNIWVTALMEV